MRREFSRASARPLTSSASIAAWRRSLNAALSASMRVRASKADLQKELSEAVKNTREIQNRMPKETDQ